MKKLAGTWYSQHGSKIELRVLNDGVLEGTYEPALGGAMGAYRVVGQADPDNYAGSRSFGLVVCWNNAYQNQHSTTVWCGQYLVEDGEERLVTTWLLTRETRPADQWAATLVGSDVFQRTLPAAKTAAPPPHPVS